MNRKAKHLQMNEKHLPRNIGRLQAISQDLQCQVMSLLWGSQAPYFEEKF
jgi:hypothetical protein